MAPSKEFVDRVALHTAMSFYVSDIIGICTTGLQLFLCVYGLHSFFATPIERRKGRLPYIVLSFVIFVLFACMTGVDLAMNFKLLYYSEPGMPYYRARMQAYSESLRSTSLGLLYSFVILGDGLLLYRCFVIWSDRWWIVLPPALLYLGFVGLSLTAFIRFVTKVTVTTPNGSLIAQQITIAYTSLTVAMNVIATALIAYKIIRAQKAWAKAIPSRNMSVYNSAARLVIESALPLTICGLFYLIFNAINWSYRTSEGVPSITYYTAASIFSSLYFSFAVSTTPTSMSPQHRLTEFRQALSPQMIIFRVTTGRSHIHRGDLETSLNPDSRPLGNIAFNNGPIQQFSYLGDSLSSQVEEGRVITAEISDDSSLGERENKGKPTT
ncbi:hypothetical protein CC2G_004371 [Coprinopsis cinerea AmutBmut pab1-1]|nr:hypothetical protein CC2G_004371 [Coprinopsis cinerea AmutBmut pab1-1]